MLLSEKSQSCSQLELSESPADEKLDFLLDFFSPVPFKGNFKKQINPTGKQANFLIS